MPTALALTERSRTVYNLDGTVARARTRPESGKCQSLPHRDSSARLKRIAVILAAGYLLFAHGCHGNEDNELFAPSTAQVSGYSFQE
jgi:hypothetical protein